MNAPLIVTQAQALEAFEFARRAIDVAASVDQAKHIRDKMVALQVYARQARDRHLIVKATEIRLRAERRTGEILEAMRAAGERAGDGRPKPFPEETVLPTLKDLGVTGKQCLQWTALARLPERDFDAKISAATAEIERSLVATRAEKQALKRERRTAREADLGAKQRALPAAKYGVIYADPAWESWAYSEETGFDRAAENHYPTMSLEAICALPVGEIAADDCALFLWARPNMLPEALRVGSAWGFAYVTEFIWRKDRRGTGYWARQLHESLLLFKRGDPPCPSMGAQWDSVLDGPVTRHSAKPEIFAQMIEDYFRNLPKIELNRRGAPRLGWDAWGLEAEEVDEHERN